MAKKNKRVLIIVASAVLLITVITVAYAYFVATIQRVKDQNVVAETGTMRLIMNDGNAGWSEVWNFGESKSKTFTLQNTGSLPVTVDLYWKNLVNTFTSGSMVYSLKESTDDTVPDITYLKGNENSFENIPTSASASSTNKIAEQITVPANKTYTYTLTIQLVNSPTVDQTADLNANFYTEFDIKEYVKPELPIKCLDEVGNEMACPQILELGQRIAIGDEVFRFIRYTSTSSNLNECGGETGTSTPCADATNGDIRALAEYNLYVGHIYNRETKTGDIATYDTKYGRQNSTARGYIASAADRIGTTEFSSDSVKGTQYSSYTGSIVEDYVEEYVEYLSSEYGANVSGSLITKAELESLGCDVIIEGACSSSTYPWYPWVYTTSYWLGSAYNPNYVWVLNSSSDTFYGNSDNYSGVRPVITIPTSSVSNELYWTYDILKEEYSKNYTTASKLISEIGQHVYLKQKYNQTKPCLNLNGDEFCLNPNEYETSINKLNTYFGSSNCNYNDYEGYECTKDNFSCDAYEDGYVSCWEPFESKSVICGIEGNGTKECYSFDN